VIDTVVGGQRGRFVHAASRDADEALVALYTTHYRSLVRLGTLLLHDQAAAEDVVQDAFVAVHAAWRRLRDPDKALAYLRQSVVNRSRSRLRHLKVADRKAPALLPAEAAGSVPSAETRAMAALDRDHVLRALRSLPQRQREVIVLRYYADLSEAQIADAMGISTGAVKSHASRGMGALRERLERIS
jgi:RNA polymerase sigma-70 factor (sigma-E family)